MTAGGASGHNLSKSRFLLGLQCPKALFLEARQPGLAAPPDEDTLARFATGRQIGQLARQRFPEGVTVSPPAYRDPAAARRETQRLLTGGAPALFEAAFEHDGVFVAADVLLRGAAGWSLLEVKARTRVEEHDRWDLAVQVYVLRGAGIELAQADLLHLNREYVRQGPLDLQALFTAEPLLDQALTAQDEVARRVAELKQVLRGRRVPQIEIGEHCDDPYPCAFKSHCWAHVPEGSVFEIATLRAARKFELYRRGVLRMQDVPAEEPLPAWGRFHVDRARDGRRVIDRPALRGFLDALRYPLVCLDFETWMPAIPPYDGLRPYDQVPFMFSLHTVERPGAAPRHTAFLAEPGADPRRPLAEALLDAVGSAPTVLAYNASFEKTALANLAGWLPDLAPGLLACRERTLDLMQPFRRREVYVPQMGGSYSIKAVLPALVPDLGYDDLAVQNGTAAGLVWGRLVDGQAVGAAAEALRRDLWDYCARDSLAAARVLEALQGL